MSGPIRLSLCFSHPPSSLPFPPVSPRPRSLQDAGFDIDTANDASEAAIQEFGGGKDYLRHEDYIVYMAGGLVMKADKWADVVAKYQLNHKQKGGAGSGAGTPRPRAAGWAGTAVRAFK